jgi:hypothetical protein
MQCSIIQHTLDGMTPFLTEVLVQDHWPRLLRRWLRQWWKRAIWHPVETYRAVIQMKKTGIALLAKDRSAFAWYGFARCVIWCVENGYEDATVWHIPVKQWVKENPGGEKYPQWYNQWRREYVCKDRGN